MARGVMARGVIAASTATTSVTMYAVVVASEGVPIAVDPRIPDIPRGVLSTSAGLRCLVRRHPSCARTR
jgi:hypothetical protein